jgi:hypothetical protein
MPAPASSTGSASKQAGDFILPISFTFILSLNRIGQFGRRHVPRELGIIYDRAPPSSPRFHPSFMPVASPSVLSGREVTRSIRDHHQEPEDALGADKC